MIRSKSATSRAPTNSCLVCTVHAHDAKTGEELARFRTA